ILFTFSTAFFGGGYMVFVIWLVLFGLGIYIHGLFSEEMLEWAGVMMILLGVAALALSAPYRAMQWLAASVFGLGMPLLSMMLDRGESQVRGHPAGSTARSASVTARRSQPSAVKMARSNMKRDPAATTNRSVRQTTGRVVRTRLQATWLG